VFATMRDGVRLGVDVYRPAGLGPAPAVIIRQPYGKQTEDMEMDVVGGFFARKGYACVVQDVRGKFSSGGVFDPGVHEVDDGYDTVDWAIAQDWCNGRVGFWGESYYGITSYAAAISGHPAIACIAPGDIGLDRRAAWFRQGAFLLNTTGYWALAMDAQEYADVSGVDPYALPLTELPRSVGLDGSFFLELVAHADDQEWWTRHGLADRIADIRVPVLSWGGWYDVYVGPQLADYRRLIEVHPRPEDVHLMIGPWDHEGSGDYTDRAVCVQPTQRRRFRVDEPQPVACHREAGRLRQPRLGRQAVAQPLDGRSGEHLHGALSRVDGKQQVHTRRSYDDAVDSGPPDDVPRGQRARYVAGDRRGADEPGGQVHGGEGAVREREAA